MAIDIMQMIKDKISKEVMEAIGGVLGTDEPTTRKAVDGALPPLMGGVIRQSAEPEGRDVIFRDVEAQDDSILDDLPGVLAGGAKGLLETGMSLIQKIFGSKLVVLLPLLARLFGLNKNSAGSLMAILGPILMSVLSKEKNANGLDASGLASMLDSQRDYVDKAIHPELKKELDYEGTAAKTQDEGMPGWVLPLLGAAVVALLAFLLWPKGEAADEVDRDPVGVELPTAEAATATVESAMSKINDTIDGITDEESARSAADELKSPVDSITGLLGKELPEPMMAKLVEVMRPAFEKLEGLLETAYKIPGVQEIVEPILQPLLEKLNEVTS